MSRARALLCAVALVAGGAQASDAVTPPKDPAAKEALSTEDRELLENLELLETMEAVDDLDLLLELSAETETGPEEAEATQARPAHR